jgi:hypothetical protein
MLSRVLRLHRLAAIIPFPAYPGWPGILLPMTIRPTALRIRPDQVVPLAPTVMSRLAGTHLRPAVIYWAGWAGRALEWLSCSRSGRAAPSPAQPAQYIGLILQLVP